MENKYYALGGAAVVLSVIGAAYIIPTKKEGKIDRLCYWLGEDCIGLAGTAFNTGDAVTLGAECTNLLDEALNIYIEFELIYPDGSIVTSYISVEMQPGQEIFNYYAVLDIAGNYKFTVILYKGDDMAKLASKTVSFLATEPPAPVCTIGELKCEGYDLYECQLVDTEPDWVLVESNSETCGYVPPSPEEAAGTVLDILVDINGVWMEIAGMEVAVGETVRIGVFWRSDMVTGDPDVIGDVVLEVTDPAGIVTYPTAVSGNNQQLGPGANSGPVEFDVTIDKAGAWTLAGDGDVNFT